MQCAPSRRHRQHTACLLPEEFDTLPSAIKFSELRRSHPHAFRPSAPHSWVGKPNTWLSNVDIDAVLFQYEEVDPTFAFMGTFPLDFSTARKGNGTCMFNNMCTFAVAQLPPHKTKFAMVINTDSHDKSGRHWIALFCRLNEGIFFFDSYGHKPPVAVARFMANVARDMHRSNPNFHVAHNTRGIQKLHSECGVFCVVFVVRMLDDNVSFDRLCRTMEDDGDIQMLRKIMWNPPESTLY